MTELAPQATRSFGPDPGLTAPEPQPDILPELWRRRWTILLVTIVVLALGAAWAYRLAPQVYRTHVLLMINPQETEVINVSSVLSSLTRDSQVLNTQVEVLRSRDLVTHVVRDLELLADPEFNPLAIPRDGARSRLRAWLEAQELIRPVADPFARPGAVEAAVVSAVMRRIEITVQPETLVLSVAIGTRDPDKSAQIVNRLAEHYIADQILQKKQATEEASLWLADRVAGLETDLQRAEARADAWTAANGHVTEARLAEKERQVAALKALNEAKAPNGSRISALEDEIGSLSAELAQRRQLEREAEAIRVQYRLFESRLKETTLLDGSLQPDARILSPAIRPLYPASPKPSLILGLALIGGLTGGAAWVLGRAQFRQVYPSRRAMEDDLGVPVVSALSRRPRFRDTDALTRFVRGHGDSGAPDTMILFSAPGDAPRAEWLKAVIGERTPSAVQVRTTTLALPEGARAAAPTLLVMSERTRMKSARRLIAQARLAGARVAGIVLASDRRRVPRGWTLRGT